MLRRQGAGRVYERPGSGWTDPQRASDSGGHREVPVNGIDEVSERANAWMLQQVLATGVQRELLTNADTLGAVRAFVREVRFPIHKQRSRVRLEEGRSRCPRGANLGRTRPGVLGQSLSVAAESEWRVAAGRESERRIRAGQRGSESAGA